MATVPTEYKRIFLRELKWSAEENGKSLFDSIKAAARGRVQETASGQVIISTAANGQQTEFSVPSSGSITGLNITPIDIASLCEELITRYESAVAATGAETDGTGDAAILAEMLAMLIPADEVQSDFSEMVRG